MQSSSANRPFDASLLPQYLNTQTIVTRRLQIFALIDEVYQLGHVGQPFW
jgi:hypothetical protein